MSGRVVNGGAGAIEVEVREDEEQKLKLQEIIDLLVAAGYFRARIKGLSSFDKVVGGMTWCIETCNFEVDVDLLFQENLTIGQRISLTEKIVAVLPAMQCPYALEPHQIQGLDFIHIFPVIQWLVKCSLETRQQMGKLVRGYAVRQLSRWLQAAWPVAGSSAAETALVPLREVYRPRRLLCRHNRLQALSSEDSASLAQATLQEYGGAAGGPAAMDEFSPGMPRVLNTEEVRLAPALVGSIVSLQAQEIVAAAQHYTQLQASSAAGTGVQPGAGQAQTLQRCASQLRAERSGLQRALAVAQQRAASVCEATAQLMALQHPGRQAAMGPAPQPWALQQLQRLVQLQEGLRAQELQFREQCRTQLAQLQLQVQDQQAHVGRSAVLGGLGPGDGPLAEEAARVQRLRLALARRTRAGALLQRQLDEVPGRAELAQYQRRFLELYNQVAAKHKETKQFYTMYNTLDDTKLYASKELSLLNSILDNYSEAMASAAGKEQFMQQFDAIVEGIEQSKAKAERRRAEERQRRDWLGQQLQALVEQQRQYVSAVRHLTLECGRSERLLAQLRSC